VFDNMNARIRALFDEDHQIGHTYFLEANSWIRLRDIFADAVIPMLREYFYGSWDKICLTLGCPYDRNGQPQRSDGRVLEEGNGAYQRPMVEVTDADSHDLMGIDTHREANDLDYRLSQAFLEGKVDPEQAQEYLEALLTGKYWEKYRRGEYHPGQS
jgi:hypothetical protein